MHKYHIMAPGPTELPPSVLAAGGQPILHHRSLEFRSQFAEVCENLKHVFLTNQPVLTLSAGGTGGMESCIVNFSDPGETLLVITGGVFGERWAKIAESLGRKVIRIDVPWGQPVDPQIVAIELLQNPQTVLVLGTLSETSTGVEHPISQIARLVACTDALFAVDAISGLAVCEFRMDEWEVDVAIAGTQKGLMSPPGLSLVALSDKALKTLKKKNGPKFYWSYDSALKSLMTDKYPDSPWTPNVSLILQLRQALTMILDEGLENVWIRHQLLAKATREGILAMGLQLFNSNSPSAAVTVIKRPEGVESSAITKHMLNDWGISIVNGQGKMKGEVFRIGHIGYCDRTDVLMTLAALEAVLWDLHYPVILGSGVSGAQNVFLTLKQREIQCLTY